MILFAWVALALIAAAVTDRVARWIAVSGPLRRRNYRGLDVPTAGGIAVVVGCLVPAVVLRLVEVVNTTEWTRAAANSAAVFGYVVAGFALLGLWDDVAGTQDERGWRAHLAAVRAARPSAGTIKMVGALALSFLALSAETETEWLFVGAPMMALCANAFNLLDLRPGRSGKVFLLAAAALLVPAGPVAAAIAIGIGAVAAFLRFDLRERCMLGDTGALAIGAFVGWGVIERGSHAVWLIVLVVLIVVHVIAERPGLTRLISSTPGLRRLDTLGRVGD